MILWAILGIIFIIISVIITKYTYHSKYCNGEYIADLNNPVRLTVWKLLLMILVFLIPGINISVYTVGMIAWIMCYSNNEIRLEKLPRIIKWIHKLLLKEL